MGFRNYDPGLNRFLTRDTYGGALDDMALATDPFTMNRYAFAGGNPISNIEIDGHFSWKDLGNALGGAATSAIGNAALATPAAPIEMASWFGLGPGISGAYQNGLEKGGLDPGSGAFKGGYWATEAAFIAMDGAGLAKTGGKAAVRGIGRLAKWFLSGGDDAATIGKAVDDLAEAGKAASSAADSAPSKAGAGAKAARPRTGPARAAQAVKCSFLAGTGVLMADGSHKNIEQIQTGDQVTATDPETGDTRPRTVVEPLTEEGKKTLIAITVDLDGNHGSKTAEITATDNHPFWLPDYGRWADAGDLKPGMWLRTSTGTWIQIAVVTHRTVQNQRVHNLTVAGTPTYYVMAGVTPVLVHNCRKNQGIYLFRDLLNPGKLYVGKTMNFAVRIAQHLSKGRLKSANCIVKIHVCGTEDDVYMAEDEPIERLRGNGWPLSNDYASPGKRLRREKQQTHLWSWQELRNMFYGGGG